MPINFSNLSDQSLNSYEIRCSAEKLEEWMKNEVVRMEQTATTGGLELNVIPIDGDKLYTRSVVLVGIPLIKSEAYKFIHVFMIEAPVVLQNYKLGGIPRARLRVTAEALDEVYWQEIIGSAGLIPSEYVTDAHINSPDWPEKEKLVDEVVLTGQTVISRDMDFAGQDLHYIFKNVVAQMKSLVERL